MTSADPEVARVLRQAMIARIATRSARGTPQIMPLWFVRHGQALRMTNAATSPTVRNILAGSSAVIIVEADRQAERRCLRLRGRVRFLTERRVLVRTVLAQLAKYHLAPAAVFGALRRPARIPRLLQYYRERSDSGVIEFTPDHAEFMSR